MRDILLFGKAIGELNFCYIWQKTGTIDPYER
jgi:hypothetical protein